MTRSPSFFLSALGALALASTVAAAPAWMDSSLPPRARAEALVRQMTLDEKVSQIHMMDVKAHPREVVAIPRLGIPAFKITNGPAGAGPGDRKPTEPATALPAALGVAASWDPTLAHEFGAIAGAEVKDRGEHLLEGPGVNITRVPQNGRNFEYFGEDPWLSGRLGVAEIRGIQGADVIAEVKHFAANNQEYDRKTINELVDERTLREIYLPAFEAAVKEGDVGAVMAAYPSVNGEPCCENTHLLQDILRGDWGFKGLVQSDYTATRSAVRSGRAGLDLSMKPDHYGTEMKQAVLHGEVPESAVDAMLVRRFTLMFQYGMFDHSRDPRPIPAKADGAKAREIAEQSAVLLKNEGGMLPLDAKSLHSIALIGPYAGAAQTGGLGSSAVVPLYTVTPLDGLRHRAGAGVTITYQDGADVAAAVAAAKAADVVVVEVGNTDSEGKDRPNLSLPDKQDALVSAVAAANPRTIVVLKTGGPVLMPWVAHVAAILEAWYPGEEDGNVVAALLFGDVDPSGRLPLTFPVRENEVPANTRAQYPGVDGTATYSEKLLVGYRWYDARNVAPLFPFGFGLSYTSFTMSDVSVSPYTAGGPMSVQVSVTNTGARAGAEVVQVYVTAPAAAGEPPKQLKGFAKVALEPHQTRQVNVALDPRAFSIWDTAQRRWTIFPGRHEILVGSSSRDLPLHATVDVPQS
ncbi:MAG TPA: glycoside hydrolase family 3 C-terminal domain-containing protein [Opitutaceae bacterium]|nr:glycoside hydrolase family 3 C-terminal domain-containing protein [Opitutaceae bacterium]